jgi:hypothetical protein
MVLVGLIGFWQVLDSLANNKRVIDRARNFYGTVTVSERAVGDEEEHDRVLRHGAIMHGQQFVKPEKRRWATMYYGENSGVGKALRYFNDTRPDSTVRVGAVGLGVGTLATYARKGDQYRIYEINPEVDRVANKYFTYLSDYRDRCGSPCEVVLGDARLSLERELKDQGPLKYDVLVLDAFSGDAIPTHLLTEEAFATYTKHLAPGGVIAVHITNSYLYLAPVVQGLADNCEMKMIRVFSPFDERRCEMPNYWALLTTNPDFIKAVPPVLPPEGRRYHDDFTVPLWTDQYNNLFQILQHD